MGDLPNLAELHAKSQRNLRDFLQTDLALCFTFLDVAITDLESPAAAKSSLAKAEQGYDSIQYFLPQLDDGSDKEDIAGGLKELRARLNLMHSRLQ